MLTITAFYNNLRPYIEVNVMTADVRDLDDMCGVLAVMQARGLQHNAPGSVIWAAGVAGAAPLATMTDAECWEVLAPKVAAAATTREMPKDSNIVLFSSVSAAWCPAGGAHYAASNAFLDALAVKRSGQGSSTLSVRFGPFSGAGMISTEEERLLLERVGLGCLDPGNLLTVGPCIYCSPRHPRH
jgi:NADP-dependent 3-hydroxy acid dehydrogenase YdfG